MNVTTTTDRSRSRIVRNLTVLPVALALVVLGWLAAPAVADALTAALAHPFGGVVVAWVVLLGGLVAIPFAFQAAVDAALSVID